jgi:hypothetical protein
MEKTTNAYRILVGKSLGQSNRRWEDNIEVDLRETCCEDQRWSVVAERRV